MSTVSLHDLSRDRRDGAIKELAIRPDAQAVFRAGWREAINWAEIEYQQRTVDLLEKLHTSEDRERKLRAQIEHL